MSFVRGAIIQYMDTFLIPLPNVIVFQYNPESITHSWSQVDPVSDDDGNVVNPLSVKSMPGESFSMTIAVDATDMIADGSVVARGIAEVSGVYTRLAALEMLLFPTKEGGDEGLVGQVSVSVSADGISAGASAEKEERPVPAMQAPVALFVWGLGRIVPVRVTSLTVTEKIYDSLLNPTHAEAQLDMRVLTPDELEALPEGLIKDIANVAYKYSQGLREALAIANLANSAESSIGMLPI